MDFINNISFNRLVQIALNDDDIISNFNIEQNWYTLSRPELTNRTERDNALLFGLMQRAIDDIHTRFGAYIAMINVNHNLDNDNIIISFEVVKIPFKQFNDAMKAAVHNCIVSFMLMATFEQIGNKTNEEGVYYKAWKRNRAKIALLLASTEK